MKIPYNVIIFDFNTKRMKLYNIMSFLLDEYNKLKIKPGSLKKIKKFILDRSKYQWWGRCEYEIILSDWPCQEVNKKIDIYTQIESNIDVIINIFMQNINYEFKKLF